MQLIKSGSGTVTLSFGGKTYGGSLVLVPKDVEATLTVSPFVTPVTAQAAYVLKSVKIGGAERKDDLKNGTLAFTPAEDTVTVAVQFDYAEQFAGLFGTVRGAGDIQKAAIVFVDLENESAADGCAIYRYTGTQKDGTYNFTIADGTYRLWLEYNGSTVETVIIKVENEQIKVWNESESKFETVESLDFQIR